MIDISTQITALADRVFARLESQPRIILALAGAPGSGKTTLAGELARRLRDQRLRAEVVPMDGFHLDNAILDARGLRSRKGAPETFDAAGFRHLIERLKTGTEVIAPLFDRTRDIAIAGAQVVHADCQVVICEGNYLLFDEPPWDGLAPLWDISVRLDVPLADLRMRLIQRWLDLGLSGAAAKRRVTANDIPNAARIIDLALPADFIL